MARIVSSMMLATALVMAASGAAVAEEAAATCDALAGSPQDIDLPTGASGISFADLNPNALVENACLAAIEEQPSKRRFHTHLGRIYAKHGNYLAALQSYRVAHSRGSAVAANNLGAMYIVGQGVPADEDRATQYIRKAANRGLTHAMMSLATRARTGRGMRANNQLAVFWYEKAYEAGDAVAANDLGVMYQNGDGVRENDERAMELFAEALQRDPDNSQAIFNIANAYETGQGVPVDFGWARAHYVMAFNAGDADAAAELGRLHAEGLGSVVDNEAAAEWYSRGASQGSLSATVNLADAYLDGEGVEANPKMAQSLYHLALDLSPNDEWNDYIKERLDVVRSADVQSADEPNE